MPKRKRGIRLVFSTAKGLGEIGLENEPTLWRLVKSICADNNYKIRRDGVIFLKEYFKQSKDQIIVSGRFREEYVPTLFDLINDEDIYIQIEALETCVYVLE